MEKDNSSNEKNFNVKKDEVNKIPVLDKIGVKPGESTFTNVLRVIALVVLICYLLYMIYDDYMDDLERDEKLQKLFSSDTEFYNKLALMDQDTRTKYLDAVKSSLEDTKTKKQTLFNSIRTGLVAGMLSEFIASGSNAKVMGTISKTIIYSSISAFS